MSSWEGKAIRGGDVCEGEARPEPNFLNEEWRDEGAGDGEEMEAGKSDNHVRERKMMLRKTAINFP